MRNCHQACSSNSSTIASTTLVAPIELVTRASSRAAATATSSIGSVNTIQCCRTSSMTTSPSSEIRWRRTFGSKIRNRPIPAIHSLPCHAPVPRLCDPYSQVSRTIARNGTLEPGSAEQRSQERDHAVERTADGGERASPRVGGIRRLSEQVEKGKGDERPDQQLLRHVATPRSQPLGRLCLEFVSRTVTNCH